MSKSRVGGKFLYTPGEYIDNRYTFVGIDATGKKDIVTVDANSIKETKRIAKALGYKEVVKNSVMPESVFKTVAGQYGINSTPAQWKEAKEQGVERLKKKKK